MLKYLALMCVIITLSFGIQKSNPLDPTALNAPEGLLPTEPKEPVPPVDVVWTAIAAPATNPHRLVHATVYNPVNDRIYMIAGNPAGAANSGLRLCQEYNPETNTWTDRAPIPEAHIPGTSPGLSWVHGSVVRGKVFINGGIGNNPWSGRKECHRYCPAGDSWTLRARCPNAHAAHLEAVWRDSLIYVMGGVDSALATGQTIVDVYNPFTNTWHSATPLPWAADMGSAVCIGDTIYIRQAYNRPGGVLWPHMRKGAINPANPLVITWLDGPVNQTVFNGATAAIEPNFVYWGGGFLTLAGPVTAQTWRYSKVTGAITDFTPFPVTVARCQFMAARVTPTVKQLYKIAGDDLGNWSEPNNTYFVLGFYANNLTAGEIVSPTGIIPAGISVPVQAIISNTGDNPMTFDVRFTIGGVYTSERTGITLPAGRDTIISFDPWTTVGGNYTTKCSILTPDDFLGDNVKTGSCLVPAWIRRFEPDDGMLTPAPVAGWEWGTPVGGTGAPPSAYSPPNCWATNIDGNYSDNADWTLTTPWLEVYDAPNAIMAFQHWYNIEGYWDVGQVWYRRNVPADPWKILDPIGGYPQGPGYFPDRGYGGAKLNWSPAIFPLGGLGLVNNDSIQIRWRFRSDPVINYAGWYIDDFCAHGIRYRIRDVGVHQILAPVGDIPRGTPVIPSMIVKNYGTFTAPSFPCTFRIFTGAGTLTYTSIRTVIGLLPESTRTVTFDPWTPTVSGDYRARGRTAWALDQVPGNDTMSRPFFVFWKDVGLTRVIAPVGSYLPGTSVRPEVVVRNFGVFEEFDVMVTCSVPTLTPPYLATVVIPWIGPGGDPSDSVNAVFDPLTVTVGSHTAYFRVYLIGDLDPTNNVRTSTFSGGRLDVGVTAITAPTGTHLKDTLTMVAPKCIVKNYTGTFMPFKVFFRITKGASEVYIDSQAVTTPLDSNATREITFTARTLYADTGDFVTRAWTVLVGDEVPGNDVATGSYRVILIPPGWYKMPDVSGATKAVKGGGALTALGDKVYALIGNNTYDFMEYAVGPKTWTKKTDVPLGPKKKKVKKGAALTNDGTFIYVLKGGNTQEFYRYNPLNDSWKTLQEPGFTKGIKGGSMAYDGDSFIYAIRGSNDTEWKKFNIYTETWTAATPATLPQKMKFGSWIVYVPSDTPKMYCLRVGGKTNEFYKLVGGSWSPVQEMPLVGAGGKKKKAKGGSAGAYVPTNKRIYALKGGNTIEFYSFNPAKDSWKTEPDVGAPATPAKRVKDGGALAFSAAGNGVFAFVGNGINEFWLYVPPAAPTALLSMSTPSYDGIQAGFANLKNFTLNIVPNPTKNEAYIYYTLPSKVTADLKLYNILGEVVYSAKSDKGLFVIDSKRLPAGIYILRFKANEFEATRKLIITR